MNGLIRTTCLLALLAAAGAARAQGPLVDLQLRDLDRGQWLPRHPHEGRNFVAGEPGHRYAIVLQNLTPGRVLAVVSVDGVNVVSGQTAATGQAGYVLEPWQRLEVNGWRKSLDEVAAFRFGAASDSYAARTGRPGDVGVIGVAAFRERQAPPRLPAVADAPAASAEAAPLAQRRAEAGLAGQSLGTAHGERRHDPARLARFERAQSWPDSVVAVHYDSLPALVARGVLPPPARWRAPEPFPGGFVPDPS